MPNALLLGLGGCGSRVVDSLVSEAKGGGLRSLIGGASWPGEVSMLVVDTDRSSLERLDHVVGEDRMHLAKDVSSREDGKSYFREVEGRVMDEVGGRGRFDIVFVFVGGGGLTGSPFAPLLADRLNSQVEGPVYCVYTLPFQNEGEVGRLAVEGLRELWESGVDCVLLVDNSYAASKESSDEFPEVNSKVAGAVYRLLEALEQPMVAVADLGDLKSTLSGGDKIGTLGMVRGVQGSVDQAVRRSLGREGLLFPVDVYNEGSRAFIVMEGPEEGFSTDKLREELGNLSEALYHVFKGIVVDGGPGFDVLSVVSMNRSKRLEEFTALATEGSSIQLNEVEEF